MFTTGRETVKGRNLRRTGQAVLTVDDPTPPFAFVTVTRRVELRTTSTTCCAGPARIGGRYMGEDVAEQLGRRNAVPEEMLVRLVPDKVAAYDGVAD